MTYLKELLNSTRKILTSIICLVIIMGIASCDTIRDWTESDSPTEPTPFIRDITVDFACDGVSANGATIQLFETDGVCRFQCVDLSSGGVEPFMHRWTTSIGNSNERNPAFEVSIGGPDNFRVRLTITDDNGNSSTEERFFQLSCI